MKTTIDLPDELMTEAKAVAARRRTTLKAMMEHALRREVMVKTDHDRSRCAVHYRRARNTDSEEDWKRRGHQ